MNTRATLANVAWLATSAPAHRRFGRALSDPGRVQSDWLREHLNRNAETEYGRAHGAPAIRSYADFARQLPIVTFADLEPWINRVKSGESGLLTREPITRLIPTSGSTGARKLIPFTATLQREFNAAIGPWISELARAYPSIAFGPAYWSVTPMGECASDLDPESAVPVGFDDDSEYLGGARAWLVAAAWLCLLRLATSPIFERFATPSSFTCSDIATCASSRSGIRRFSPCCLIRSCTIGRSCSRN